MWKRNELCSKGVPCRSRMRKRIRPSSDSSISSLRRAKLTRAAFTTERSVAIASSRRTNPWSRTRIVFSCITWSITATKPSIGTLYVGASGFSYPTWRGGFYPERAKPSEFLRLYAERLPSVELNTTGYRLPPEDSFRRWAEETPPEFRFAVKLPAHFARRLATVEERLRLLGARLGVLRVVAPQTADPGFVALLVGSLDPALPIAFDFRHRSWDDVNIAPAVRVDDWDADAPFRYLRFRDPPYTGDDLHEFAEGIRRLLDRGIDVYAYFKHEDEPSAPLYAERLLELTSA